MRRLERAEEQGGAVCPEGSAEIRERGVLLMPGRADFVE